MSAPSGISKRDLNEALRHEWESLAWAIAREDPDGSCPHLRALRLHAEYRIAEYTYLIEREPAHLT